MSEELKQCPRCDSMPVNIYAGKPEYKEWYNFECCELKSGTSFFGKKCIGWAVKCWNDRVEYWKHPTEWRLNYYDCEPHIPYQNIGGKLSRYFNDRKSVREFIAANTYKINVLNVKKIKIQNTATFWSLAKDNRGDDE